jgi:hypothetical protein
MRNRMNLRNPNYLKNVKRKSKGRIIILKLILELKKVTVEFKIKIINS